MSAGVFIWKAEDIFSIAKELLMKEHRDSLRGRDVRLLGIRCSAFRGAGSDLEKGQTRLTFGVGGTDEKSSRASPLPKSAVARQNGTPSIHERSQLEALRTGGVDETVLSEMPKDIGAELSTMHGHGTEVPSGVAASSAPIISSLRRAGAAAKCASKGIGYTQKRRRGSSDTRDSSKDQNGPSEQAAWMRPY